MSKLSITPICAFDINEDGLPISVNECWPMATAKEGTAYRWLHFDLASEGLEEWTKEFLPTTASSALREAETRPRTDFVDDGVILNLRGVNLNPGSNTDDMVSLRLWISKGLIVSARIRKVWALDDLRIEMEAGNAPSSIGMFLAALTFGLTKRIESVSIELEEEADAIEEESITDPKNVSIRNARCRQSVIKIRRFIRPQKEALVGLADNKGWFSDEKVSVLLQETVNKTIRSVESLDAIYERLLVTQDHLDVAHASALGRNSYVLSIVAAIFLPLGFITGLFGINVGGMPGIDSTHAFWFVTGGSVITAFALFAIFRFSKWL